MSTHLIEASLAQRGALPLPSAALVIDMRGIEDDDVINRLRIEITDLASEMKIHEINHWRFLTGFLSFRAISPLRAEDVASISTGQNGQNGQSKKPTAKPSTQVQNNVQQGLTGEVGAIKAGTSHTLFEEEASGLVDEDKPFDVFRQQIDELAHEINRIRNNRIAAVTDLNRSGIPGRSVRDATVRIIFLTDASNQESLVSASAYAAKLKEHFNKLKRENHPPMVSVTIVCLNHSAEAGPPTNLFSGLLWDDDWKHIDSLLISEQIREDGALIEGTMQTYLAELLLYVLLIIPPLAINTPVSPSSNGDTEPVALLENKQATEAPKGKWIHLPAATYLVGLAAIEHSARWGRRWINYGITAKTFELLQSRDDEEDLERRRIHSVAESWLKSWLNMVMQAIPDKIPGNIPALRAIPNALDVSQPRPNLFTSEGLGLTVAKTTLSDLHQHLDSVLQTYSTSFEYDAGMGDSTDEHLSPSLQDAVDSIPQIQQRLREWENRDPALKKGTPLVNAQFKAQSVLSHQNFFTGAKGAVPRARMQLRELSGVISDFKNKHEQDLLELDEKRQQLQKRGTAMIDDLESHIRDLPLLASKLRLRVPMAILTAVLFIGLAACAALLGAAWLRHAALLHAPGLIATVDNLLFFSNSAFAYLFWAVIIVFALILVFVLSRPLFDGRRTNTEIEAYFCLTLIIASIVGFLFGISLDQLASDPTSLELLTPLSAVQPVSLVCFITTIVILLIELVWFLWWRSRLLEERNRIVNELHTQHAQDIRSVTTFIAETIGLQILQETGLTDGRGGPGAYYHRVDQLYRRLDEMAREAEQQHRLAADRLVMSMSETQPGTASNSNAPWLNLKIREEWLDVTSLVGGYKRIIEQLSKEKEDIKEFAEMLLRVMGEETPLDIEQQFREKITSSKEQRPARVFMETLVAVALRFAIAPQSVTLSPIIDHYENIDSYYIQQLPSLSTLVETLNKKVRDATIQPLVSSSQTARTNNSSALGSETIAANIMLGTDACATWSQMLWEKRDEKLDKALIRSGILAKLMENDDYDARAVMRRLQVRTALFGRSIATEFSGEARLILSPSAQSRTFRQSLSIPSRLIIDFPDIERLLLLYIQRYQAEPQFVPETTIE